MKSGRFILKVQGTVNYILSIVPVIGGSITLHNFWATISKTVHPILSDRCPFCPVCNICLLWPTGWTDQDETWHAGRPRPQPHCVRWGPSSPQRKGAQQPPRSKFTGAGFACIHIICSACLLWPLKYFNFISDVIPC